MQKLMSESLAYGEWKEARAAVTSIYVALGVLHASIALTALAGRWVTFGFVSACIAILTVRLPAAHRKLGRAKKRWEQLSNSR